jgi:hypothetical protein
MRDGRLQGIEAIVERQQRMPPESNNDRLLRDGKDGGRAGLAMPLGRPRTYRRCFAM